MRKFALILLAGCANTATAADWLQFGYDEAHSGYNPEEGLANNGAHAARWHVSVHAFGSATALTSDSTPVYLSNVSTPLGTKDLLFLVTQNGTLIAFAASDGAVVWSNRPTPFNSSSNLTTGAAAIDPNRQYVYAYGLDGYVHKYQVGDGTEITGGGWPELSTLKPNVEKGASGLAIASPPGGARYLYHVTNGYVGDAGDYQGHVTAINLSTGAQNIFNTQCSNLFVHFVENGTANSNDCVLNSGRNGQMSGIWGRPGAIYDAQTNRIYVATGNALFDANVSGHYDWGDSVLALNPDGTGAGLGQPLDSYTPSTYASLYGSDIDLGSTAPAILPSTNATYPHLAIQSGKDSCVRLINLDNMSGAGGPGHIGGELNAATSCSTDGVGGGVVFPQPAVWINPADSSTWAFVVNSGHMVAYRLNVSGTPTLSKPWNTTNGGTSPVTADGILYYAASNIVRALNPLTGAPLWSASIGGIKWQSPIVVDGNLYITDNNAQLWSIPLDKIFRNGFE
jgi:hypothetical protein